MKRMKNLIIFTFSLLFILSFLINKDIIANHSTSIKPNFYDASRIIEFSDQKWLVESYMDEKVYPGPNYFSSSEDHVWIDQRGFLTLNIQQNPSGKWMSSSVKSLKPAQYGIHRFRVIGNIEKMDKNTVLGLFMYRIDPNFPDKRAEVDIEFSTWGLPYETNEGTIKAKTNGHYTLWNPWNDGETPKPHSVESFWVRMPRGTHTMHEIIWTENKIEFNSYHGHAVNNPNRVVINQFTIVNDENKDPIIPHENDNMHIMLNFWIHGYNSAPYEDNNHQMKIKYEFEPIYDF